jgi:hypothetical protein
LPFAADLTSVLQKESLEVQSLSSMRDLASFAAQNHAYLAWGSTTGSIQAADVERGNGIPRQYLRRRLSDALGCDEWDWGLPRPPELLRETVEELRTRLKDSELDDYAASI